MQNENEEPDLNKQSKIEQIKKFCAELDPDIKVLIIGAGSGEAGRLLKSMNGISSPLERMRLIEENHAVETPAAMITEDMIRKIYKTDQLCVIVEDADKVSMPKYKSAEVVYTLTNPYKNIEIPTLTAEELTGRDPKKKHWDKPKFMGGDEPIVAYRSGGNNRKTKKRKKAKNGRKRK